MPKTVSLTQARKLIVDAIPVVAQTEVHLEEALGRISARSLKAELAMPSFHQSTRDGFAVHDRDISRAAAGNPIELPITGEIAAGCTDPPELQRDVAIKIMTGGLVPKGANVVIPFEKCTETPGKIRITASLPPWANIRKTGSDLQRGKSILPAGSEILPDHLSILATAGLNRIPVREKPRAAIYCTGSELVPPGSRMEDGQVISGNRFLLGGLVSLNGGEVADCGTIRDDTGAIARTLGQIDPDAVQLVLTTGGMGPGKYDLMEDVFSRLGIEPLFTSINVRPGKSTMFGMAGNTAFFALPGPPPAVRILFHELVLPAIRKMQGRRRILSFPLQAELTEDLSLKKKGMTNLKGAIFSYTQKGLAVRPALKTEAINCIIHLSAAGKKFRRGDTVDINPVLLTP